MAVLGTFLGIIVALALIVIGYLSQPSARW